MPCRNPKALGDLAIRQLLDGAKHDDGSLLRRQGIESCGDSSVRLVKENDLERPGFARRGLPEAFGELLLA